MIQPIMTQEEIQAVAKEIQAYTESLKYADEVSTDADAIDTIDQLYELNAFLVKFVDGYTEVFSRQGWHDGKLRPAGSITYWAHNQYGRAIAKSKTQQVKEGESI